MFMMIMMFMFFAWLNSRAFQIFFFLTKVIGVGTNLHLEWLDGKLKVQPNDVASSALRIQCRFHSTIATRPHCGGRLCWPMICLSLLCWRLVVIYRKSSILLVSNIAWSMAISCTAVILEYCNTSRALFSTSCWWKWGGAWRIVGMNFITFFHWSKLLPRGFISTNNPWTTSQVLWSRELGRPHRSLKWKHQQPEICCFASNTCWNIWCLSSPIMPNNAFWSWNTCLPCISICNLARASRAC